MEKNDQVEIISGVYKGQKGIITDILEVGDSGVVIISVRFDTWTLEEFNPAELKVIPSE